MRNKKLLRITISGYHHAPESFQFSVYDRRLNLPADERQRLGYLCLTKGHDTCVAEVKRLYRKMLQSPLRCTIGFLSPENPRAYYYCSALTAYDDSLAGKLAVYKKMKGILLERGCRVETSATAILGAGYRPESVTKTYDTVDITRPVKVYIIEPAIFSDKANRGERTA